MSVDAAYEKDLIEFLSTLASTYRKPPTLKQGFGRIFNQKYSYDSAHQTFRERALQIFSKLHEINLDTLNKVEMLYIFNITVSEEMKKELSRYPSFRYTLNGKGKLVKFSSGDGFLSIEEKIGKSKEDREDAADGAPAPKKRRTDSEEVTENNPVEAEVKEEPPEEAWHSSASGLIDYEVHRRGSPDQPQEQPMERRDPGEQGNPEDSLVNQGAEENQGADGAEVDVKPIIERMPEQLEQARSEKLAQLDAVEASEVDVPTPTIRALDLAKGLAGLSFIFKTVEWHNAASEKIKLLLGKEQTVLLEDFSAVLQQVLSKINSHKKIGFRVGSIRIRDFLLVLQTSVLLPLGTDLMSDELEKINGEIEKMNESEEKTAQKGEAIEMWMIPKEVVESCIKNFIRLTCY